MTTASPVVVVVGPSGHGATALLQCLCGLADAAYVLRRRAYALGNGLNAYTVLIDRTRDELIERHTRYARVVRAFHGGVNYSLVSVPGRPHLLSTFIRNACLADSAVLVVAADVNMEDPTNDAARVLLTQAIVLKALEIEDIVVCVTKLDLVATEGGEQGQQQAFERTKRFVLNLLTEHRSLGFHPSGITVVGVSIGAEFEQHRGIINEPYAWSDGGKTFTEALQAQVLRKSEAIARAAKNKEQSPEQQPMRLPIHDSYRIAGLASNVICGRQLSGLIRPGDSLACCPSDPIGWRRTSEWRHDKSAQGSLKSFQTFTVEMFNESRSEAKPGDVVGVCARGRSTAPFYAYPNGAVIMPAEEYAASLVELTAMELVAQVETVGAYAKGKPTNAFGVGYTLTMCAHNARVPCLVVEVITILDSSDGLPHADTGDGLSATKVEVGQVALVRLRPLKPVVVEEHAQFPLLGRVILLVGTLVVGHGKVKSVVRQLKSELTALISPAHVAHVSEAMSAQPAIVTGRDQHHNSLLHLASKELGCHEIVQVAIDHIRHQHSDDELRRLLDVPNADGLTALQVALAACNEKAATILVASGARFDWSVARGHHTGGCTRRRLRSKAASALPSALRNPVSGRRRPLSLALSCVKVLNANRANYANLEEALPETELRRVAAAALHSFLCSGGPG